VTPESRGLHTCATSVPGKIEVLTPFNIMAAFPPSLCIQVCFLFFFQNQNVIEKVTKSNIFALSWRVTKL
jgi:hypothetical protein